MILNKEKCIRYLEIAGFLIRINLTEPDYEKTRANFITMIDTFFMGFLLKTSSKNNKPDFYIDVKTTETYMYLNREKNAFVKLYNLSEKQNRIITYYSISIHQLQFILMQILFWLLTDKGFIVHCSAVKKNNKALLFLGKQGAGKSTTANLLSGTYEVLADDNGVIKRVNGEYFFYQCPTIEKNENIIKSAKACPIQAIYFLNQSSIQKIIKHTDKKFILRKMTYQYLGDLGNKKQKLKFLFTMISEFLYFYSLFTSKDKIKLKHLIDEELF